MACCDICGAVYTLKTNLMCHIFDSHHENEPSPLQTCDQCNYVCTFNNLMYHKKNTHSTLCTVEFTNKCNLNCHVSSSNKGLSP